MATILYARVSTVEQTVDHQLVQARDAGFAIDDVVSDNGVSGVHTRLAERPEGKRLFDKLRAGDVLVVRWVGCRVSLQEYFGEISISALRSDRCQKAR
jgi:putative DNA-invertase from lambdoid prophage Rac